MVMTQVQSACWWLVCEVKYRNYAQRAGYNCNGKPEAVQVEIMDDVTREREDDECEAKLEASNY